MSRLDLRLQPKSPKKSKERSGSGLSAFAEGNEEDDGA